MTITDGSDFGRYRIISKIGAGGMGQVFRAFDTQTNREVALKVLPADFATSPEFRERFQRESNLVAGLREPHIIPIHDFGDINGQLFLDMRLIDGVDARTILLSEGPLSPHRAIAIIDQVAAALDAAHAVGLEHRDVKPANILVADRDFVYLIDFGIARAAGETGLTSTGLTIGTFAYMAPERFGGGESDHRADVYSLACVLYELLTGTTPFPGKNVEQQIAGHLHFPPPQPTALVPGLPAPFDAVVVRGMAKIPEDRFETAGELAAAASAALIGEPNSSSIDADPTDVSSASDAPTVLRSDYAVTTTSVPRPSDPRRPEPKKASKRNMAVAIGVAGAVITAGGVYSFAASDRTSTTVAAPTSTTQESVASPGSRPPTKTTASRSAGTAGVKQVEVIGFTQVGTDVSVRIHNPNPSVGLVRSGYELTLLDSSGSVIATQGQGGVAGTVLNTVYQLPPNADYGITADAPAGKKVDSVELTILGKWHDWGSINAPGVSVTSPSIKDPTSTYGPTVVGRLSLQGGSPANVMVQSFVSTPAGSVVSSVVVDCVRNGEPRSFEAMSFAKTAGPFTVEKTVAYPTSVDGVEPSYPARC